MDLANDSRHLFLRPILVTIIASHDGCCEGSAKHREKGACDADCAKDGVNVIGPAPTKLHTDLKSLPDRNHENQKSTEDVQHVPQLPVSLQITFCGEEKVTKGHPSEEHPEAVRLVDTHAPLVEELAPAVVGLAIREKQERLFFLKVHPVLVL